MIPHPLLTPIRRLTLVGALLASLISLVESADSVPTKSSYAVFDHLSGRRAREIKSLRSVIDTDVPAFVARLREAGIPLLGDRLTGA